MPDDPARLPPATTPPAAPPVTVVAPAEPHAAVLRTRRWRVGLVIGGLLALLVLWEVLTSLVAYTSDAYVRSDLVAVSAEVSGHIAAIHVADNQAVRKGDLLVTIDPTPFQLAVDQRQAQSRGANALADAARAGVASAQDQLDSANATLTFAQEQQRRAVSLNAQQFASQQDVDQANERLRGAQAAVDAARATLAQAQQRLAAAQAAIAAAEAALAEAEWELGRTELRAPVNGTVTNFTLHVGDTARADVPVIGIVDADAWRIVANYKQDMLRFLPPGGTAWVWLDAHPWHFHRARIASIARGISRNAEPDMLLPYVAPTTDWIRLQRRFPVTITLENPPPDLTLYMGADARVVIFP
jgi:membrane fusion protein, multidrug efflux system